MTYKERLIKRILEIDPSESEKRMNRLPIRILESWIPQYRKWNPDINPALFDMSTL